MTAYDQSATGAISSSAPRRPAPRQRASPTPAIAQNAGGRVVVVGGGFAGATCARTLKRIDPRTTVTLVEASQTFTACPFSNTVIAGLRDLKAQQFGYEQARRPTGSTVTFAPATGVDADAPRGDAQQRRAACPTTGWCWRPASTSAGTACPATPKPPPSACRMPGRPASRRCCCASSSKSMEDGGLVVISAPANPFRCPPGPYERASLIAHYLKTRKPKSKLIILDAKDAFSKQGLFLAAWKELYPDLIEWVPLSKGGRVTSVDPETNTLTTEFGSHKAAVANVIPPQKAARIAELAGVADKTGWCPIDPVTFESKLQPNIHVIGDACDRRRRCRNRRSRRTRRPRSAPRRWRSSSPARSRRSRG